MNSDVVREKIQRYFPFYFFLLLCILCVFGASIAGAQTEEAAEEPAEIANEIGSETASGAEMAAEFEALSAEADIITEEALLAGAFVGEVAAISEEGAVLLETTEGEFLLIEETLDVLLLRDALPVTLAQLQPGNSLVLGAVSDTTLAATIAVTPEGIVAVSDSGAEYLLPNEALVARAGAEAAQSTLSQGEEVTLLLDESGAVKAVEVHENPAPTQQNTQTEEAFQNLMQEEAPAGRNLTLWIVGGLLFLAVIGFLLFK